MKSYRKIRLRILFVFGIALATVIALIFFLNYEILRFIERDVSQTTVVSLSERQRMLSQTIVKDVLLLQHNEGKKESIKRTLDSVLHQFDSSHHYLEAHLADLHLPTEHTIHALFKEIEESKTQISKIGKEFVSGTDRDSVLLDSLLIFESAFLPLMDAIIIEYEGTIPQVAADVRSNVSMANYLIVLLLIIAASIVFYITISTIKKYSIKVETAKQEVIKASKAKEQFFASMSHEIRTPLNAINGLTQILLSEDPREDQVENLSLLRFSGDNLLTLINDILDISKIGSGKLSLEYRPFDFRYLIHNIPKSLGYRAKENMVKINVHYDERLPQAFIGDVTRLSQIIYNLTGNAIKFAKEGVVDVSVLFKSMEEEKFTFQVSVKDNGIGIAIENQEKIFKSFEQADVSTARTYGGTGLGLYITKSLLQLMGSDIQLESEVGKGSHFYFELTLERSSMEGIHTSSSSQRTPDFSSRNIHALVAEDNQANQIIISKLLSKGGITYDLVDNGEKALEMIKNEKYDLVFMDLQMPVMDGFTSTMKIRSNKVKYYQEIPIIALTADVFAESKEKALSIGMTDYLGKPFKPAELYQILEEYTSQKE